MEIVLLWCFVLAWMTKRGAEDLVHAVKGTPNPRYELKKAKARAAGQQPKQQPRYGGKEWFADLMSDAMVAHTEKRRTKAAAKAQPVDDMIGILREPKAQAAPPTEARTVMCGRCLRGRVPGQPCKNCEFYKELDEAATRKLAEWDAERLAAIPEDATADETLAQVIQFPNIKHIEKEITMPNSEATGLTTAIAFADAAATAHETFSTAGSEGYAGALAQMGFGEGITSLAAEAREASSNATAKWAALSSAMQEFMAGREFYANNPDAPEKVALVNE